MNRTFLVPLVLGASGCGLLGGDKFVGDWLGTEYVDSWGDLYFLPDVYVRTYGDGRTMTYTTNFVLRVEEDQVAFGRYTTYVGSDGSYSKDQGYQQGTWERVEKGRYALSFSDDLSIACTLDDDEVDCSASDDRLFVFEPDGG